MAAVKEVPPAAPPAPREPAPPPPTPVSRATISALDDAGIAFVVERAIRRGELPGCAIAVGTSRGIRYLRAFGERSAGEPMTLDTRFDLASLTKPMATAISVMQLVEQGRVALQAPAARYLHELRRPDKAAILVEHLLLHTSGLPKVSALADMERGKAHAIHRIASLPLQAPPGSRFNYSDLGFILLGELVERVSGSPLDAYARTQIYAPLAMRDTLFLPRGDDPAGYAPTELRDDRPIRGVVDDPRAYRLGGVAGHAGLFSTAADVARFAIALLRGGALDGQRVLAEETVRQFLTPRPVAGGTRALGWDADSPYAHGRGLSMSDRAVGHGGYTGTSLWIDPHQDLFVVLLSNRVHAGPQGSIHPLASAVADLAVRALADAPRAAPVYAGIDVLAAESFARLRGRSIALLTHGAARDHQGQATLDRLRAAPMVRLKSVLTPEHGFHANSEGHVKNTRFGTLPVYSLFGKQRKPTPSMLKDVDSVVIDLVDVGARFYTYMATVLRTLEAASELGLEVVLLDRPNPIDGVHVEGPFSQARYASFVNYHPLPLRHGMTAGELARWLKRERALELRLHVVRAEGWRRDQWFDAWGGRWFPPSPNLQSPAQAMLYPAVGLVEGTNLSVGRGTGRAFSVVGAPFIDGDALREALAREPLPGVSIARTRFRPTVGPYAGTRLDGVAFELTDAAAFSAARLGLALISALWRLYPDDWDRSRLAKLVASDPTLAMLEAGEPVTRIAETAWRDELSGFLSTRRSALLYGETTPALRTSPTPARDEPALASGLEASTP